MDLQIKNFPQDYTDFPSAGQIGYIPSTLLLNGKMFRLSLERLAGAIGIEAVGAKPIIMTSSNAMPNVNNAGDPLVTGDWAIVGPGIYTNVGNLGSPDIVVPASSFALVPFVASGIWGSNSMQIINVPAGQDGQDGASLLAPWVSGYVNPETGTVGYPLNAEVRKVIEGKNVSYVNDVAGNTSDPELLQGWSKVSSDIELDVEGGAASYGTVKKLISDWDATKTYTWVSTGDQYVFHNGVVYSIAANQTATSTDVPGASAKWIEKTDNVKSVRKLTFFEDYHDRIGFFKELYLYGSGLNPAKIYYLRLVVNNDPQYQNGFFIAESDPDFSNSVNVISVLNVSNANRNNVIRNTNATRNISIAAIVDWSVFPQGNTGEVLRLKLADVAKNINFSPAAAYDLGFIDSSVKNLNNKAVLAEADGKIYGGYVSSDQLVPASGESADDTNNFFTGGRGYGVYEVMSRPVVFDKLVLPFTATSAFPVTLKIAVLDTQPPFSVNFPTAFEPFVVYTKVYERLSATGRSTEFTIDRTIRVTAGKILYIFVSGGANTIRISNFNTQNAAGTRHNWRYSTASPEPFEGSWISASGNIYLQPQFGLYLSTDRALENRVANIELTKQPVSKPRLCVTSVIYAVVGKQLNIYYDAIILGVDKGLDSPGGYSVQVICSVGSARDRCFQYKPIAADAGSRTITFNVYDAGFNLVETRTASLVVLPASQIVSTKNVLMVGDSTLNNGPVVPTLRDNLLELGGNTPIFRGGRGAAPNNHQGWPGASYASYALKGIFTLFAFSVTGVTSAAAGAVYSNNGSQFTVQEVFLENGSGYIKCSRTTGTNNPTASGTLTKVSGGGDASFSYSSYSIDPTNPFWNNATNELDIANFRATLSMGAAKLDVVCFRLGVNESFGAVKTEADRLTVIGYIKTLITAFLADNPSTYIIIELPTTDGNTREGWAANYGAAAANTKEYYQLNVWRLKELILDNFDNVQYHANVSVCMTGSMVDRYYGFGRSSVQVADRIAVNVEVHNNAVHPSPDGYRQIADAVYPHLLSKLQ